MKVPLTVAIIGCGWAGHRHARAFLASGAAVRWAIDPNEARARSVAELQSECRVAADYAQALNDPNVQAIDICLPHDIHAEVAVAAARAGKHVLCEKPMATSLADADRMIDASDRAGVVLMIAENEVFSPLYQKVRDLVRAGAIGAPALVQMTRGCYLEESFKKERPWFLSEKSAGGGMMMSGGVHDFQKLRMIVGEVTQVYSRRVRQRFGSMEGDDTSVALLTFANGATGIMIQSFLMKNALTASGTEEHTLRIEGDSGSIFAQGTNGGRIRLFRDSGGDPTLAESCAESEIIVPELDTFQIEAAHFIHSISAKKEPTTSGREMRKPLELVLAAYRSMSKGTEVTLE